MFFFLLLVDWIWRGFPKSAEPLRFSCRAAKPHPILLQAPLFISAIAVNARCALAKRPLFFP